MCANILGQTLHAVMGGHVQNFSNHITFNGEWNVTVLVKNIARHAQKNSYRMGFNIVYVIYIRLDHRG